ncbi:ATP-binding cassette domain-containing protein [Paenibacillus sp. P96]|uniref:ATP-binding cassette domain-containing protein n=1 Tax=Paenibacillus zeirhizosphaerae TaxID=2987519 RepID=A0ABT9FMI9_9BACL|nr:ATP-binding cassette domain-containing protein [Paenibacillus sp. P96]MDP4095607.1 ATP-binding cassette domain-containing protein [Paenibacillus sp. P96]
MPELKENNGGPADGTGMSPVIVMNQLSYHYDGEQLAALSELTLSIRGGEHTAIIGASGSGKSTLCQLLNGTLSRAGLGERMGRLTVFGQDPAEAEIAVVSSAAGVVLQDPDAQLIRETVEDEVAFGPENLCVSPDEIERRLVGALETVGLAAERQSRVRRLSGGQRQRTGIAAVLALQPRLVVFDDAAANLDPPARHDFVRLCRRLRDEGRTVVTASGRMDETARAAERVIVLAGGAVLLDGPPGELLRSHGAQLAALGLLPSPHEGRPADEVLAQRTSGAPLLEVKELSFTYPGSRRPVLAGTSFALAAGETVVLLGENGTGKTTLGKLLMGLLPVPRGRLFWRGADMAKLPVWKLAAEIGYVFQQPEYQFAAATVWEECLYSVRAFLGLRRHESVPARYERRASELLGRIGLQDKLQASPYLLSGGEKRLLSTAAQFVLPRTLYILDEPTAGTDYKGTAAFMRLCREQSEAGAALLVITHDSELANALPDRTLRLTKLQ